MRFGTCGAAIGELTSSSKNTQTHISSLRFALYQEVLRGAISRKKDDNLAGMLMRGSAIVHCIDPGGFSVEFITGLIEVVRPIVIYAPEVGEESDV